MINVFRSLSRGRLLLPVAAVMLLMCACTGGGGFDEEIQSAEMALAAGDMRVARSVADHLLQGPDSTGLSASRLARLSMVYIRLAEHPDYTEMAANAVNCYRKAYELNPDSARAYYDNLDPEQVPTAEFLYHLVSSGDAEYDGSDYPDSLTVDSDADIHVSPSAPAEP